MNLFFPHNSTFYDLVGADFPQPLPSVPHIWEFRWILARNYAPLTVARDVEFVFGVWVMAGVIPSAGAETIAEIHHLFERADKHNPAGVWVAAVQRG